MYIKGLRCRECNRTYQTKPIYVCEWCFGPLEVEYNYEKIKNNFSREKLKNREKNLWRYKELLPIESNEVTLNEGFTPLIKAENLGKLVGLNEVYIKNDSINPTFSFKDRVVSVAITKAKEFGFKVAACASTGNLAGSVSAYSAKAGLKAVVFIPADLEYEKIYGAAIYNPIIVGIKGNYDKVNILAAEVADKFGWAFVNVNLRPYYSEGSKTLGFEVVEQLGIPDSIIVPCASGSLLTKIYKGINELIEIGFVSKKSFRLIACQPEGCNPIVKSILENNEIIEPQVPNTIVKSLAIGNPADGYYAYKCVKETRGTGVSVTDEETINGIKIIAENEGIFTETAGGVVVAAFLKLAKNGYFSPYEKIVLYITGCGYKTPESIVKKLNKPVIIEPDIREFEKVYDEYILNYVGG
ncbi:MAG: threonine synthase [bacterium]|nr:threonine synthase [bacterium]